MHWDQVAPCARATEFKRQWFLAERQIAAQPDLQLRSPREQRTLRTRTSGERALFRGAAPMGRDDKESFSRCTTLNFRRDYRAASWLLAPAVRRQPRRVIG